VEVARGLAADVLAKSDRRSEQIARDLFRRCLVRQPDQSELAALVAFYSQTLARFEADSAGAKKIVSDSDHAVSAIAGKFDPVPLAAWTLVARGLLNLDEAITKE